VYKSEGLLKDSTLIEIKALYDSLPEEQIKRYYNLFYLTQRTIPRDKFITEFESEGLKIHNQYFLDYIEGSFTKAHSDNNDLVKKTSITLVEVNDLVGGDIIVYEPHYKSDMEVPEDGSVINRYNERDAAEGRAIIPVIVKQEVGETIAYGPDVMHSVSKVLKGNRIVLVTWYE
jgi:predicted 2-oxoglutarate/Fe(II)-dependent dioxygenase YbiX|tara:strand:+ start:219 stop:740 length:522 start_codon:yes stop_codon:yes gene_type:complete